MNPMMHMHYGIEGRYRLRTRKAGSGIVTQDTGWQENVITNRGLELMYSAPARLIGNCAVSTETSIPTEIDSSLGGVLATVHGGSNSYFVDKTPTTPMYSAITTSFTFPTGAAQGNISKIGVFSRDGSYNGDMVSILLIKDDQGNPTSITVLPKETLDVLYEIRMYLDDSDKTLNWTLGQNTTITGTSRLSDVRSIYWGRGISSNEDEVRSYYNDIVSVYDYSGVPDGYAEGIRNQFVNDIANSGTCWVDGECTFDPGNGDGTLKSFIISPHSLPSTQIGNLSQPIVKGQGQYLNMTYRYSWGRHTP